VRQPVTRREVVEVERVEVHEREVTTESVEVSRYVLWWWRFTPDIKKFYKNLYKKKEFTPPTQCIGTLYYFPEKR
jgi:hypothetical protein